MASEAIVLPALSCRICVHGGGGWGGGGEVWCYWGARGDVFTDKLYTLSPYASSTLCLLRMRMAGRW